MATCSQTSSPVIVQQEDPCNGIHTSTDCVVHSEPITYLFIEDNENLTSIIQAIVLSLQSNNTGVTQLQEENAQQAIEITNLQQQVTQIQEAIFDIQAILATCCPE